MIINMIIYYHATMFPHFGMNSDISVFTPTRVNDYFIYPLWIPYFTFWPPAISLALSHSVCARPNHMATAGHSFYLKHLFCICLSDTINK